MPTTISSAGDETIMGSGNDVNQHVRSASCETGRESQSSLSTNLDISHATQSRQESPAISMNLDSDDDLEDMYIDGSSLSEVVNDYEDAEVGSDHNQSVSNEDDADEEGEDDDDDDDDDDDESRLSSAVDMSDHEFFFDHDTNMLQTSHEGAVDSLTSSHSVLSDLSEPSSPSSVGSSKATTPAEDGNTPVNEIPQEAPAIPVQYPSYKFDIDRLAFNIRPKSSVPTDISSREYAHECILAAESSRLNPYALHPDEYELFRHHISHSQVTTYLNIRNGILRLWIRQPWVGVTRQAAIGCANARWFDAASVCYDWLIRQGYINYGCVRLEKPQQVTDSGTITKKRKTIAVIGAGISGLSCARHLKGLFHQYADRFHENGEEPPNVVILEGRSRVGGRVYSREFKTVPKQVMPRFQGKRHTAEMGGMIITGFERGNPVNTLVRGQLGLSYHPLTAETTIYDSNGKPVDPVRDDLVEKLYNDCLDRVSEHKYKTKPSKLIEGNRDLINEGRDSPGDGTKTIIQSEEATAALPDAPSVSQQNVPERVNMVPVSSDKLTGRVHTQPGVAATLKASEKAKLMGWKLRSGSPEMDNIDLTAAIAQEGSTLGSVLDHSISQYRSLVDLSPQDYRLMNWHIANLEYSNATNLHNLSLRLWDIDAGNEWDGPHTMIVGGYQSVARGLLECPEPLDIKTKFPVKNIKYAGEGRDGPVSVESEDGSAVEADAVVCTIPLGVLKHDSVGFEPPLPSWKTDVVGRLGFGILNKVILVYDKVFWNPDRHIFGVLRNATNRHSTSQKDYGANRGRLFQWFNVSSTTGMPCLIALMAGDAGFETEHSSNNSLVAEATDVLRKVFGSDVPNPVEAIVTRWGSDRFARGSYSSAAPGMLPDDYDTMARPVGNLFFAGEHTIGTHPATVHGAYLSGLRAASEVLDKILGPIEVPTPLVLPKDSLLLQKRKQSALDPRQARVEAYELEVWDHIRSQIGERPVHPTKVASSAYILYTKDHFDEARARCEERNRKSTRTRSTPNDVRVMCSKMWKETPPEIRKPYEDRAVENRREYAEALERYNEVLQRWDRDAITLRAAYEKEHPMNLPGEEELAAEAKAVQKLRRGRASRHTDDS